jgi:hypothetical protein
LDVIQILLASGFYHYLLQQDNDVNTSMKYVKTLKQVMTKAVNEGMVLKSAIHNLSVFIKIPTVKSQLCDLSIGRSLTDIKQTFRNAGLLYDQPDTSAARILQLAPGSEVIIKGTFKNYELVTYKDLTGWVYDKK